MGLALLLPSNLKSYKGFRLAYLDLTMAHSKDKGQGHSNYDCESLKRLRIEQTLLPSNNVEYGFRLVGLYLELSMAYYEVCFWHILTFLLHSSYVAEWQYDMHDCVHVRMHVRRYVTKWYREQKAGIISAKFGTRMQVDKIYWSAIFIQITNVLNLLIFKVKVRIEYIWNFMLDYLANGDN